MTNNLPASFVAVFDNKLPRKERIDIAETILEQSWCQKTVFDQRERFNQIEVIVKDANLLEQAMVYVNGLEGVIAEDVAYLDTQGQGRNCFDPRTWTGNTGLSKPEVYDNAYAEPGPLEVVIGIGPPVAPNLDKMDEILTSKIAKLAGLAVDIDCEAFSVFVETAGAIDADTARQLKSLGVKARATETKATFVGEVSLRALCALSHSEVVEQLIGSRQYQAL